MMDAGRRAAHQSSSGHQHDERDDHGLKHQYTQAQQPLVADQEAKRDEVPMQVQRMLSMLQEVADDKALTAC